MARRPLDHVRALQAHSLGFLLVRAGQLWSERVLAIVQAEAGAPVVRESHTRLFPYLMGEGGARITDLARALGVTKQAVQPLVAELASLGMVRVEVDPGDARARRVVLTDHGVAAMVHGTGVLLRVEAELAPRLGARDAESLKRLLAKLLPLLEAPAERAAARTSEPPTGGELAGSRAPSRGRAGSGAATGGRYGKSARVARRKIRNSG